MAKAKLPPGPLRVFSDNNVTAILDANGNEVVFWQGFDQSERTRAEHNLLARELVRRYNAADGVSAAPSFAGLREALKRWDDATTGREEDRAWELLKSECSPDTIRALLAALDAAPGVAACVTPKDDSDALLIDNLFRATLGRNSDAIDKARMALRQMMNELRTRGVPACDTGHSDWHNLNSAAEAVERVGKAGDWDADYCTKLAARLRQLAAHGVNGTQGETFRQKTPLEDKE